MTGLFRSEEMCLCQLYLQTESAYAIIGELGEIGIAQFRDLNPKSNQYMRKYVGSVRRCEEMERKLYFIKNEMRKDNITPVDLDADPPVPNQGAISELENQIQKAYQEIHEMNSSSLALRKSHAQCTEMNHMLRWADNFLNEGLAPTEQDLISVGFEDSDLNITPGDIPMDAVDISNGHNHGPTTASLSCFCGVVNSDKVGHLERVLWRSSRGNIFFRWADIGEIDDPDVAEPIEKCAYILFFPGTTLQPKLKKICDAFHATLHRCPQDADARREMVASMDSQMKDMEAILNQSKQHRYHVLEQASKKYNEWLIQARKAKSIFHTLNFLNLDLTRKTLIGECWVPVRDLDLANAAINRGTALSGASVSSILNRVETDADPPTYNRTNKFTGPWQSIINAYGYGNYREVNPTLYTIITFPFLFGVMYGDAGHGTLVTIASGTMCIFEKKIAAMKIRDDIFNTFYNGRYVLLSMGLFAIYTGSIYNEYYSKSSNVWGSSWRVPYSDEYLLENPILMLDPNSTAYRQYPYPYGFDPAWYGAQNALNFKNSFKMKISVIIGIIQMFFGVLLSLINHTFFHNYLDIFTAFIPQLLFLLCIFVYLVIQIFYKWIVFPAGGKQMAVGYYPGSFCAPNLLVGLINMFMFKTVPYGFQGEACATNAYYPYQNLVQQILFLVALLCIPWMLLVKPIILKIRDSREKKKKQQNEFVTEEAARKGESPNGEETIVPDEKQKKMEASHHGNGGHGGHSHGGHGHGGGDHAMDEEFSLGEALIQSAIHTVEYCLGLVSHTASYLRLWALSLAHSELAEVLWVMVVRIAFKPSAPTGAITVYLIFIAFAGLTIAILIFMDALSVFLHALRLHWVEFQSKFYQGLGHGFEPLCFKEILALAEQQDFENERNV